MAPEMMKHHAWSVDPDGVYRNWLVAQARTAERIAEVGVLSGKTTRAMAEVTGGTIYAVDHWKGVPGDPVQDAIYRDLERTERVFWERSVGPIIRGRIVPLKMGSLQAATHLTRHLGKRSLDLVFIDADHRYWPVRRDIRAWRPLVRPGGILAGHDRTWPGVKKALAHECPGEWSKGPGSLWYIEMEADG